MCILEGNTKKCVYIFGEEFQGRRSHGKWCDKIRIDLRKYINLGRSWSSQGLMECSVVTVMIIGLSNKKLLKLSKDDHHKPINWLLGSLVILS
jgi:hypothetical protein